MWTLIFFSLHKDIRLRLGRQFGNVIQFLLLFESHQRQQGFSINFYLEEGSYTRLSHLITSALIPRPWTDILTDSTDDGVHLLCVCILLLALYVFSCLKSWVRKKSMISLWAHRMVPMVRFRESTFSLIFKAIRGQVPLFDHIRWYTGNQFFASLQLKH